MHANIRRLFVRKYSLKTRGPWIIEDDLSFTHSNRLETTLKSHIPALDHNNSCVPRGSHLIFFNHNVPEHELGADGYDNLQAPQCSLKNNEILARRWHGGSIKFNTATPLVLGRPAICNETLGSLQAGPRRWEIVIDRQMNNVGAEWSIVEKRKFTYFTATARTLQLVNRISVPPKHGLGPPRFSHSIKATPILLFRYSALSFNAHLIHYNTPYAQTVEQMPDVVVQGPLMITLLLRWVEHCASSLGMTLSTVDYSNLAPVFVNDTLTFNLYEGWKASIVNGEGNVVVEASITLLPR